MTSFLIKRFVNADSGKGEARKQYGNLSSVVGIVVNVFLSIVKVCIGLLSGSIAILGDGINNVADSGSAIISLASFHIGAKPADKDHPFGHARFEYISSSIVAISIIHIAVGLFRGSINKIMTPDILTGNFLMYSVLIVSILAKIWLYLFYKKIGTTIDSGLILANADDSMADVLSTSSILLATVISALTGRNLDGYMGVVVSIIIFKSGFDIMRTTFNHLMGALPDHRDVKHIENYLLSFEGVLGIHDLIMHDYGPGRTFVTVHIEVDADKSILESHALVDHIERQIKADEGISLTIHMDPLEINDPKTKELIKKIDSLVKALNPVYSIHDFRVVDSGKYTNVVFDVLIPADAKEDDADIEARIKNIIKALRPDLVPVIVIDRDYIDM